jgi:transposase
MPHLSSNQKHNILMLYRSHDRTHSFESLAHQYNIKGGKHVIQNWYKQWNGTPESLQRKKGSGKHAVLTSKQVKDYIQIPIRNKNRTSTPVHYTDLLPSIQQKIGKKISLSTIQKIGKQKLGVKQKRTIKRTVKESNQTQYKHLYEYRSSCTYSTL